MRDGAGNRPFSEENGNMSMATLERAILAGAQTVLKNPRLKKKDILEWNSGDIKAQEGEVVIYVGDPGVYVAVNKKHDKRK
jgi:hypothetical protein